MRPGLASVVALALCGATGPRLARAEPTAAPVAVPQADGPALVAEARAGRPLWATVDTSQGELVLELESAAAPQSVATFVGYATGVLSWKERNQLQTRPLYAGTVFHRVVPGFAIQGGDPTGTGNGGPGQTNPDDTGSAAQQAAHFTRGSVGMAHLPDPKGIGSQFFILVGDAPWLDGRTPRIGHVISGMNVADAIANAPRGPQDRPLQPVTIRSIRITDRPPKGKHK